MNITGHEVKTNRKNAILRDVLEIVGFATVIIAFLLLWAKVSAVDRNLITDRIVSREITEDTAIYHLDLSDMEDIGRYSLHFKSYGNTISILADGEQIYSYSADPERLTTDIGRIYVSSCLPEKVDDLEIILIKSDANASLDLVKIELCEISDTGRYYLTNDTLGFPMALIYVVIGFLALAAMVILSRNRTMRKTLLFFSLTLLSMAVELADTGGHYLVLFTDQYAWNILFYFACYTLPVVAALYCYSLVGDRFPAKYKRIAMVGVWINIAYGVICTGLALFTDYRFCDFVFLYSYNLIICMAFTIFALICLLRARVSLGSIVTIMLGFGAWGITALIFTILGNPLVNTSENINLDMESLQAVFILIILGSTFINLIKEELQIAEEHKLRVIKLEKERQNLRYKIFASQMQPHFLYNALSSIQQIVYEDQDYAASLIRQFTIHLRATIRAMSDDKPIPFRDELKNIKAYIYIEQMRFGDLLSVKYDIQVDDFEIVPLCVQPLVENAVKHGIYQRGEDGGTVEVKTGETEEAWIIEVSDDGVGFSVEDVLRPKEGRDSVGLSNLIYRLENLMHATVDINSIPDVGTHITIAIPKTRGMDHESNHG